MKFHIVLHSGEEIVTEGEKLIAHDGVVLIYGKGDKAIAAVPISQLMFIYEEALALRTGAKEK